jgi:hypothetical protein
MNSLDVILQAGKQIYSTSPVMELFVSSESLGM